MTGPKTFVIVTGPTRFGVSFLEAYGRLRFFVSSRTLSPFWSGTALAGSLLAITAAACACAAIVFSLAS